MVSSVDFKVDSILVSAYVASDELAPARILRRAMSTWGELYDADPVSLPLPPGVPAEVPSVFLSSTDGVRRLEVARARASVVMTRRPAQATLDIHSVLPELGKHLNSLFNDDSTSIGRLAVVVNRTAEVSEPAMTIARHYFQERWLKAPLNRPQELEVHAHKVFELRSDLPVNSWVRIRAAKRVENNVPVIAFEQDINSLEEDRTRRRFDAEDIVGFYQAAARELSTILDLYFPANGQLKEG